MDAEQGGCTRGQGQVIDKTFFVHIATRLPTASHSMAFDRATIQATRRDSVAIVSVKTEAVLVQSWTQQPKEFRA
jgi:hypothetical protein